jgi:hypothetical protein
MAFGQDFLKGFFGNDYLKDYRHASKTFRSNGYANAPKFKYLFHVYFGLNYEQIPQLRQVLGEDKTTIGLLVKDIDLPKFRVDTETLNQYNRKRVIQKKIEYQPSRVTFHDDGGDLTRKLWYNYYSYYYKDPSQKYGSAANTNGSAGADALGSNGSSILARDIYENNKLVNDWGFIGESYSDSSSQSQNGKPAFFRDIRIYGFNQHRFVEYVLINPVIQEWNHDSYDYYNEGVMENSMTVAYETVKYFEGAIGGSRPDTNAQGFADPNAYDTEPSPLSRPGGTRTVLGQGGLLDVGIGIYNDLQQGTVAGVIGAIQTAGRTYETYKGQDLRAIVNQETRDAATGVLRDVATGQQTTRNVTQSIQGVLQTQIFPTPPRS